MPQEKTQNEYFPNRRAALTKAAPWAEILPLPLRRLLRGDVRALPSLPRGLRRPAPPVGKRPKRRALFVEKDANGGGYLARGQAAPRRLDLRAVKRGQQRVLAFEGRIRRVGVAARAGRG